MKPFKMLVGGTVVLENGCQRMNILIHGEKIAALVSAEMEIPEGLEQIHCEDYIILPGAIDTHSHFFEPGETAERRDDFHTATMAAAAGGYTTCIEMPQSIPPVVTEEAFEIKKAIASKKAIVDFMLWGGMVPSNMPAMEGLWKMGCAGFKAFTSDAGPDYEMCTDDYLLAGMERAARLDSVVGVHAENNAICNYLTKLYREKKPTLNEYHEASRPWYAELEAIRKCILFSRVTNAKTMICHMTIPEGARELKEAKSEGVPVYVETCPHYLLWDTDTLKEYGAFAKCNPPLRSPDRRNRLWDSVFDGTIDVIGSDHAAYTEEEKMSGETIFDSPCGFPGLQLILPGLLTEGVNHRKLSLERFVQITSTNAAKLFGLYPRKGCIRVGSDADFAVVSLKSPWVYTSDMSFSKGKSRQYPNEHSSYEAKVIKTMVRGNIVYEDGTVQVDPGFGKWVEPIRN